MSLGIAVHNVLEGLGNFKAEERMNRDLKAWFNDVWKDVSGIKGGFTSEEEENTFKTRGEAMIENVIKDPRFLVNKCIRLPKETMNPNFYLSEEHNIILNGLIDWIEYLPETNSLHIVDFKTGKNEETEGSLQLPIYILLCNALQKRKVTKASYWYLEGDKLVEKSLPDTDTAYKDVLEVAMKVKNAREKNQFMCPQGASGCIHCKPYEAILKWKENEAVNTDVTYVGVGGFNQDMFVVAKK